MRKFELLLMVFLFFLGIFFVFYSFFAPSYCEKYSGLGDIRETKIITELASCKDSFVCEIIDQKKEGYHKEWTCERGVVDVFHTKYYIEKFNKFTFNIFK